ncbi:MULTISPECIES: MaoC family dehydratase [unclassified Herbaspirillum]|uniref:MaoC family dehydratase n=1 Tax=unclassified Herbaspirillum TaxID=2624150 RepID=UPI0011501768|nr:MULTISPECIES: MaoC family dehydratase [unclassified Herbaspirillum]MBB5393634.1 acyl dehydratase [Herbaspirillum sp. SJZ102]TQK03620.1 acyl dehydratase [Herbaspirillum sp. SJZ130]TQK08352.1 acyl dehydratase [Herbaspirillum sp. SJZ106]TWC71615.1 acyl dehydratase [Herbaspirillum sp. SJZ099]
MREIATLEELKSLAGQEVATSDWIDVTQEQVNRFADATGDHQWIHVDVERAARELPFGGTVAHGFLTLALLPQMLGNAISLGPDVRMLLNYGLNRVRFPAPLPVGRRVRGIIVLESVEDVPGGAQLTWEITVECEGSDKPVCVAQFLVRRY